MSSKTYYVYILASKRNGTLYVGITEDLKKRLYEHKAEVVEGFTKRSHVHQLVYFEQHSNPQEAIKREKLIKRWKRVWKLQLIESTNPNWVDLYNEI